jgi:hypothetical protein
MDHVRNLRPTPSALRNGRIVLAALAGVVGVAVILIVLVPGFGDAATLAIAAATIVTLAGHVIAYVGQPTLTRYRVGLVVITVGIVAAFWLLIANPSPPVSN